MVPNTVFVLLFSLAPICPTRQNTIVFQLSLLHITSYIPARQRYSPRVAVRAESRQYHLRDNRDGYLLSDQYRNPERGFEPGT